MTIKGPGSVKVTLVGAASEILFCERPIVPDRRSRRSTRVRR